MKMCGGHIIVCPSDHSTIMKCLVMTSVKDKKHNRTQKVFLNDFLVEIESSLQISKSLSLRVLI